MLGRGGGGGKSAAGRRDVPSLSQFGGVRDNHWFSVSTVFQCPS